MCGIAALWGWHDPSPELIQNMLNVIQHRGPDGEGSYRSALCHLGHRRLSIVDLSDAALQPMHYLDRYSLVFNGEIYNYLELREKLSSKGYVFHSQSDTEVILAAYAEWGKACLEMFNGMWAFILYDNVAKTLFVARDRFGIKPLYYWQSPSGGFAFASEIKQFLELPGWTSEVHPQLFYDYLGLGFHDHTEETLFRGVKQLKGGCSLWFEGDTPPRLEQWYVLRPRVYTSSFSQALEDYYASLSRSVNLRLRADVPIGSCLSGGLDSSGLVALAAELRQKRGIQQAQKTFSACFDDPRLNEARFIRILSEHVKIQNFQTNGEPETLPAEISRLVWHHDEPTLSTSQFAQWKVFQLAAKEGLKVLLDGQGADEGIGGYHLYLAQSLNQFYQQGQWQKLWQEAKWIKNYHGYSWLTLISWLANRNLPQEMRRYLRRKRGLFIDVDFNLADYEVEHESFEELSALKADCTDLSLMQINSSRLPNLLHSEDRNSMAHSIEGRVPYLDHEFVEFILALPWDYKIHRGTTKHVQREALKSILPEAIYARRDKLGFEAPQQDWLLKFDPHETLSRMEHVQDLFGRFFKFRASAVLKSSHRLHFLCWKMLNLSHWAEQFKVKPL